MSDTSGPQDIKERTFEFAVEIVRLCRGLAEANFVSRRIAQQLLSSGTSIGANVEEAQAGQSQADFISKYSIALKEARETIYWLRLLAASGEPINGRCKALCQEADEIARIIGAIIVNTKKR